MDFNILDEFESTAAFIILKLNSAVEPSIISFVLLKPRTL